SLGSYRARRAYLRHETNARNVAPAPACPVRYRPQFRRLGLARAHSAAAPELRPRSVPEIHSSIAPLLNHLIVYTVPMRLLFKKHQQMPSIPLSGLRLDGPTTLCHRRLSLEIGSWCWEWRKIQASCAANAAWSWGSPTTGRWPGGLPKHAA